VVQPCSIGTFRCSRTFTRTFLKIAYTIDNNFKSYHSGTQSTDGKEYTAAAATALRTFFGRNQNDNVNKRARKRLKKRRRRKGRTTATTPLSLGTVVNTGYWRKSEKINIRRPHRRRCSPSPVPDENNKLPVPGRANDRADCISITTTLTTTTTTTSTILTLRSGPHVFVLC
jgi:hypothetical protein